MPPRQKPQRLLHEEPHVLLQKQLDELEKSIGLSFIQVNTRLEAQLSPSTQTVTNLEANLDQLRKDVLSMKSPLEVEASRNASVLNDTQVKVARLEEAMSELKVLNDMKLKVAQLDEVMSELQFLKGMNLKVAQLGEEVTALNRQERRASELKVAVQDDANNLNIQSLQTGIKGMRDIVQANQEFSAEIQKKMGVYQTEIDQMQAMGVKLSQRVLNIERLSQEHQQKLSGPHCDVASVVRDNEFIVKRQDEVCNKLMTLEKMISEFSKDNGALRIVKADAKHQAMEVDESGNDALTPKLVDIVTKHCAEAAEIQNRHLADTLESFKGWVLLAQKQELQPILEQAMQNSDELIKHRKELESLTHSTSEIGRACQEQSRLGDKLAVMERKISDLSVQKNQELQLHSAMHNQASHVAILGTSEHEKLMQLVSKKCDESLNNQQNRLEEFVMAQKQALLPIIEQAQHNASELAKQGRELASITNVKALIERKIMSIQDVNKENSANIKKTDSLINSLVQENQLVSQRQSTVEAEVSKLSRNVNQADQNQTMDVDVLGAYEVHNEALMEQMAKKCKESLETQQQNFSANLESFKKWVVSVKFGTTESVYFMYKSLGTIYDKRKNNLCIPESDSR